LSYVQLLTGTTMFFLQLPYNKHTK